jgi:general secretion pathway protein L
MSEQLVIRLAETGLNSDQQVDWSLYSAAGQKLHHGHSALVDLAGEAAELSAQFEITVIVPGESILLTTALVPSKQLRQIKQALPFMVEELIADDIDSVHIALPTQIDTSGNIIPVAIVSHRVIVDWLDELHSNRLSPAKIVSDVLCLPLQQNTITLLLDQHNVLIRSGDYAGMVVQLDDFKLVFGGLLNDLHPVGSVAPRCAINLLYSSQQDTSSAEQLTAQLRSHHPDFEIKASQYDDSAFDIIANAAVMPSASVINLLQGGYAVDKPHSNHWQRWRLAASVAAIGVAIYLFTALSAGWYFEQQADRLDQNAISLYKQLFPNERRIVSPKKQMQNHLRLQGGGSNSHFLQLLADTAQQLSANEPRQLLVEALRFDSSLGDLVFQVQSPSIENLDKIKQQLAQHGLAVDINSATEQDDHVVGRFAVRRL